MNVKRVPELCQQFQRHPTLPKEAVIKSDLLSRGVSFAPQTLEAGERGIAAAHQPKSYFIFSFDLVPQSELSETERWRAPEEIGLRGGPFELRRTIVSVRLNPRSPYQVTMREGLLVLEAEGELLADVELPPMPAYYGEKLASGRAAAEIAPSIEWGYLVYLTAFRICQYFGESEECQFCDINHNYRQQIAAKRPYTGIKPVAEILEALALINASASPSRAYTVTGGSITSTLQDKSEADFYAEYVEAIEQKFPRRWISKVVVQAWPVEDVKRLKVAGAQIYHPNYEIWDPVLFTKFCPGKARYIGREKWIRRILDAAEIFEPANVIPNFVAGIEMARPDGYSRVEDAVRSTKQGLEFFMSKGVAPRFTTWCPEPATPLGKANPDGAPLEYHLRLLEVYRETMQQFGLDAPPGYGEAGPGRAVFSVSAFMDVLENGVRT